MLFNKCHLTTVRDVINSLNSSSIEPITDIVNVSLKSGVFPSKLKLARVIPILKSGDSRIIIKLYLHVFYYIQPS